MMTADIQDLRARVQGTVLTPDHSGYDSTRKGWNLSVDQHPAVIVVAANAADVQEAVRYAHDNDLGVAIQSTGHGVMRAADDAMLIITSRMNNVRVNARAQTAWVEAGAIWKQVLDAAQNAHLAPLLGSSPYVGVVGYTLGGGMGWLARKYGLAADSVNGIEIVTPDGHLRYASPTENADLFWALRGGGGNFGVVLGMEIKLYPVATLYGGMLMYPIEDAKEVYHFYRHWTSIAPEGLTSSLIIMSYPSVPQVPASLRGRKFIQMLAAYTGAPEHGRMLIHEWLEWKQPITNTFGVMPFSDVGSISNDPVSPTPGYSSGELLDELPDEAIDVIVRFASAERSPLVYTTIRHGGGAIATADRNANAIGNRDTQFYLYFGAVTPTPEMTQYVEHYASQFKHALHPYISGGMYVNFMHGKEARRRAEDAYSMEVFQRLQTVKAEYDPDNMFRYSFNIPVGARITDWETQADVEYA
jgi:FAD/FMN-containing dehydrogenase